MSTKACTICGAGAVRGTTRCAKHPKPGRNHELARSVAKAALVCGICGQGARPEDPFTADHILPLALGGADVISNLRPAHRSCNSRGGANITNAAA